jgi:hypothetical protein
VPHPRVEVVDEEPIERFVHEAMRGLAELTPADLVPENLSLPLGLSVWMRRGNIGLAGARRALLVLRGALLAVSGLDESTEPVPLVVADPVAAIMSLAVYLDGLLVRAAAEAALSRAELAERALAALVP